MLERLDKVHATRRLNAAGLMTLLGEFPFVAIPDIPTGAEPVFLRLPVIVDSPERAEYLSQELGRSGIGVSRSYQRTLPDLYSNSIPASSRAFSGASRLASCLLTLPTHGFLKERDFEAILVAFRAAGSRTRSST
jgi:dTDP-4-amino-4,6-dideoxygalactose transaminase